MMGYDQWSRSDSDMVRRRAEGSHNTFHNRTAHSSIVVESIGCPSNSSLDLSNDPYSDPTSIRRASLHEAGHTDQNDPSISSPPTRTYTAKSKQQVTPAAIPNGERSQILQLLRSYHRAVHLGETSSASHSSAVRSRASSVTTTQTLSTIFSAQSGTELPREKDVTPRSNVDRARRALSRKLATCRECRASKTKCPLSHHMLEDLSSVTNDPEDLKIIDWAIETNGKALPLAKVPDLSVIDMAQPYVPGSGEHSFSTAKEVAQSHVINALIGTSVTPLEALQTRSTTSSVARDLNSFRHTGQDSMSPPCNLSTSLETAKGNRDAMSRSLSSTLVGLGDGPSQNSAGHAAGAQSYRATDGHDFATTTSTDFFPIQQLRAHNGVLPSDQFNAHALGSSLMPGYDGSAHWQYSPESDWAQSSIAFNNDVDINARFDADDRAGEVNSNAASNISNDATPMNNFNQNHDNTGLQQINLQVPIMGTQYSANQFSYNHHQITSWPLQQPSYTNALEESTYDGNFTGAEPIFDDSAYSFDSDLFPHGLSTWNYTDTAWDPFSGME